MMVTDIRTAGGEPCASLAEAVEKFKCPGPCGQACPLYGPLKGRDGKPRRMCDPLVFSQYSLSTLDAMRCSYVVEIGDPPPHGPFETRFAAVAVPGAVRNVQVRQDTGQWQDMPDAEIWLGFFDGPDALEKAAEASGILPGDIRLIPVAEGLIPEIETKEAAHG